MPSPTLSQGETDTSSADEMHETLIECRLCHELKDQTQYEKHRRQCNRCRNRYRERVLDIDKRRAHQRVRDRRYRLKLKQEQAGLGIMSHICSEVGC